MSGINYKSKLEKYPCKQCGFVFTRNINNQLFCSARCRTEWKRNGGYGVYNYNYTEKKKQEHVLLLKNTIKKCQYCGVNFHPIKNKQESYCSDECRRLKKLLCMHNQSKVKHIITQHKCKECGLIFIVEYGDRRKSYCSKMCMYKATKRIARLKGKAQKRTATIESVNAMVVFDRDRWRCQICHAKLKRSDRGTLKDTAPELDHIIPLSIGGSHSYINTQCACRKCNEMKSNSIIGQIRLCG